MELKYNPFRSVFSGHSHYSYAMATDQLVEWAKDVATALPLKLSGAKPIFAYRGMSGVAHATALSIAYYGEHGPAYGMIYVRKRDETPHGLYVETSLKAVRCTRSCLVFVDDFVASGATMRSVVEAADNELRPLSDINCDHREFVECTARRIKLRLRGQYED